MTEPETVIPKSSRGFTKRILIINLVLVWATVFLSIPYQQVQYVVAEAFALIGVLFGIYTGIGHMDFRRVVQLSVERLVHPTPKSEEDYQ